MALVRDRSFYKNICVVGIPIALQNLISFAVNMMDTVMLGMAPEGETLLSAASLGNQPFFVLSIVCFGLASGATVLSAQYWGKRDTAAIRTIFSMVLKLAAVISLGFMLVVILAPEWVMRLYSTEEAIIARGVEYIRIVGWCYVFFGLSGCALIFLRSVETVKISVVVNLSSFAINVFLNWVLIFGKLGFPAMGIKGAAIATLTARLIEFVVTWGYVFFFDKKLRFRLRNLAAFDKTLFRDLVHYGAPVLLTETMWSLGTTVQAAIIGHIDYTEADPVAANSIAMMIQQLVFVVLFGVANASGVIIGKTIGAGQLKEARAQADTFLIFGYVIGAVGCGLLIALRKVAVSFYNISDVTKLLAEELIIAVAVITLFSGVGGICLVGVLRCGGDTRFCLALELITLWVVAVPLAYLGAAVLHLPVPFVLLLMKTDEIIKAIICIIRVRSGKWLHETARERL